jgi:hypothetical protein
MEQETALLVALHHPAWKEKNHQNLGTSNLQRPFALEVYDF